MGASLVLVGQLAVIAASVPTLPRRRTDQLEPLALAYVPALLPASDGLR
jgi:hypothetical protein